MQDFVLKYTKKIRGRIISHPPHAHLPDAGAPPLLLGCLWLCRQVNSALFFFNSCYFHNVGLPLWYAPAVTPDLGGTTQIWGHAKKNFPALFAGVCAPQLQNRVGTYDAVFYMS